MNELKEITNELTADDSKLIEALAPELRDTWTKKQIFRTETEARYSVLNDGKHPTNSAKYWQAVREQGVMLGELVTLSFDLRRAKIERERIKRKLDASTDDLDKEALHVDQDENEYKIANLQRVAHDRCREIKMWSDLKAELDDGSFDTTNPDTHQRESLPIRFQRKVECLGDFASADERFNAISLLNTATRVNGHRIEG